jgi:hypothetical protein
MSLARPHLRQRAHSWFVRGFHRSSCLKCPSRKPGARQRDGGVAWPPCELCGTASTWYTVARLTPNVGAMVLADSPLACIRCASSDFDLYLVIRANGSTGISPARDHHAVLAKFLPKPANAVRCIEISSETLGHVWVLLHDIQRIWGTAVFE